MKSFYWHDYETWGATPSIDRPSQFAGVRTDEEMNIIGDPLVIYCQPCEDVLPHPEACMVTGIVPQEAAEKGLPEREFAAEIYRELATPGTCGVGYNSLRFDDEVTRYMLYRNFYDPYEREWQNNNSRWDIIDMVRLVYAIRPEGIEWPLIDGKPSFKLENLTLANNIAHTAAHDAFSDVEATIALARLIKYRKPALYNYVLENKSKHAGAKLIDMKRRKPLLHISSKFPSERGCAGLISPLAMHPVNKNAVIAFDLSVDPEPLASLTPEAIHQRIFTAQDALPPGTLRLPIKLIHLNKCPVLATPKLVDAQVAARLGINKAQCEAHWHKLLKYDVVSKLQEVYSLDNFVPVADPETQLYDGFFANRDKSLLHEVRKTPAEALSQAHFVFEDRRLQEILERYRARHATQLTSDQRADWYDFVRQRLLKGEAHCLSLQQLCDKIVVLRQDPDLSTRNSHILLKLEEYTRELGEKYSIIPA